MPPLAFAASEFDPVVHFRAQAPCLVGAEAGDDNFIEVRDFSFFYGPNRALQTVSMTIPERRITAFMGPSGCGKSTLLCSFNRINELIPGTRRTGDIVIGGRSVFDPGLKLINLRRAVGMVFQKANPFPSSIYENIACVLRLGGERRGDVLDEQVEHSLVQAALWDEVKDRLHAGALTLSGGQMQRLCIARAIACNPRILLLDEPCSSLDPVAMRRIEELLQELKRKFTIVLVTHNVPQAARCAEHVAFFFQGRMIECGITEKVFVDPAERLTLEYLRGASW